MRIVLQRVKQARVEIEQIETVRINSGLLLLVGFSRDDSPDLFQSRTWDKMLNKIIQLRIFPDQQGKFNLNLMDFQGEILAISQFTLFADTRKGKRPSFTKAAPPDIAHTLFQRLVQDLDSAYPGKVASGVFGADMDVIFCNWGPVTIILDSEQN